MRFVWQDFLQWLFLKLYCRRVDRILSRAKEAGVINNHQLYELDARLKYYPTLAFPRHPASIPAERRRVKGPSDAEE